MFSVYLLLESHNRVRKRGLLERGSFQKCPFLEILENVEILEILENPQTVKNTGGADHFLEILENLEIFPVSPNPLDLRGESAPLKFRGFGADRARDSRGFSHERLRP